MSNEILNKLDEILKQRKHADQESSYVASLYVKGIDSILKKIGEESTEVIIAAKNNNKEQIVHEVADLWFHCMVLLAQQDIHVHEILTELKSRFGISGHTEKASRKT